MGAGLAEAAWHGNRMRVPGPGPVRGRNMAGINGVRAQMQGDKPQKLRYSAVMEVITTPEGLARACERLAKHPVITVDTEFLRETTYYPLLCVIQMASPDEAVVIDALGEGMDLAPFFALMGNEEGFEGFPCGPPGHRDRLASRRDPAAPDLRHAGRRHGARLWRQHRLRRAGGEGDRASAGQDPPFHRLVAAAADARNRSSMRKRT